MWDGYSRRLISSAIDVDRYALLLRSLKWLGVKARSRLVCVPDTRMAKRAAAIKSAIIAQHGA